MTLRQSSRRCHIAIVALVLEYRRTLVDKQSLGVFKFIDLSENFLLTVRLTIQLFTRVLRV